MANDTSETQSILPVTVEAREAAALLADNVLSGWANIGGNDVAAIRNGIWDDDDTDLGQLVQAFAKFESEIRARISHSLPGDEAAQVKAVMSILWKREQYNGVGPDYDNYRPGAKFDMGGRVERYEKEARDIIAALAALIPSALSGDNSQSSSNAGGVEPWPGCYADLQQRRVTTLAKLGLMLSVMASGEAAEVVGYDAADLYAEVLMALAIEDADDTDIALEEARDHPDSDIMAVQAKFEALASLSTPTAEPAICQECDPPGSGNECRGGDCYSCGGKGRTPPTPDRIGKDAVREADEPYTVAMERRPKEIGGVKVGPGLYRIYWKDGGSSLAAIGMCRNGAWWVAPTNWVEPAVALRIDEDPEGRWSWAGVKALERLDPPALTTPPTPDRIGKDAVREALERISKLTPFSANAATAEDFAATVHAIADTALSATPAQEGTDDTA